MSLHDVLEAQVERVVCFFDPKYAANARLPQETPPPLLNELQISGKTLREGGNARLFYLWFLVEIFELSGVMGEVLMARDMDIVSQSEPLCKVTGHHAGVCI